MERIAIIYPEATQRAELESWLKPFASRAQMVSFPGLPQAVPFLGKFPSDVLIAADRFPQAQGSNLLGGLRKLCPKAQIILLAADPAPIDELILIARSDLEIQYFSQPWDKQSLLAQAEARIGKEPTSFAAALALREDQALKISQVLEKLLNETSALSIYLVTQLGQVLDYKGSQLARIGEIGSLLGGSFAALQQMGEVLGEQGSASNLVHRQDHTEDLYAFSVGNEVLLVLRFAIGPTAPKIGTVAFYAHQAVAELAQILPEGRVKAATRPFSPEIMESALKTELDQLFTTSETEPGASVRPDRLLSFDQAMKKGLVSKSLLNRVGSADGHGQNDLSEGEGK